MLLTSFFISRRFLRGVFPWLHIALAATVLAAALWHVILLRRSAANVPIIIAAGAWVGMRLLIIAKLYFFGVRATVEEAGGLWNAGRLKCGRHLRVFPGCYFYVFPPGKLRLSSYRVVPKWYERSSAESAISIEFFFAGDRPRLQMDQRWLIDGPYGYDLQLHRFENVLLAARGVGVVGVLSFALNLLERQQRDKREIESNGKASTALYRDATSKVFILWRLDYNAQDQLVARHLRELQSADEDVRLPVTPNIFLR